MRRQRFTIVNRRLLADEIRSVVKREFGGSLLAAADSVGMVQSTLHRYSTEKIRSMTRRSLDHLYKLLPTSRHHIVDQAFLTPGAAKRLRKHHNHFKVGSHDNGREKLSRVAGNRAASTKLLPTKMNAELKRLQAHVERRFPDIFRKFDAFGNRRRHSVWRIEASKVQILAPLLLADKTGGMERDWRELDDGELRAFVEAGVKREKILLNRSADVPRAQLTSGQVQIRAVMQVRRRG